MFNVQRSREIAHQVVGRSLRRSRAVAAGRPRRPAAAACLWAQCSQRCGELVSQEGSSAQGEAALLWLANHTSRVNKPMQGWHCANRVNQGSPALQDLAQQWRVAPEGRGGGGGMPIPGGPPAGPPGGGGGGGGPAEESGMAGQRVSKGKGELGGVSLQ